MGLPVDGRGMSGDERGTGNGEPSGGPERNAGNDPDPGADPEDPDDPDAGDDPGESGGHPGTGATWVSRSSLWTSC